MKKPIPLCRRRALLWVMTQPKSAGLGGRLFSAALTYTLVGLCVTALLVTMYSAQPAMATEPTPTPMTTDATRPPDQPFDVPCRLGLGIDCDFTDSIEAADSSLKLRTNPSVSARDVPTYTLVSVTFDRNIDPSTIRDDTFYVSQGMARVDGAIGYIAVSKMAVFYPDVPLAPNTTYTARVTAEVRDLSGKHLEEDVVWTFTTSAGLLSLGDGMHIYFGDLHSHSSYSDGQGTPADAFATARANGLDFFALTDHAFMLTDEEWEDTGNQASAATVDGVFVGLRGFEFTHAKGHINVFDSGAFVHRNDPSYASLGSFYAWLAAQPAAIGQFNHPTKDDQRDMNFNDFAYNSIADQKIVLRELSTPSQFFLSLDAGWHLGTLLNSDTHQANWGNSRRMGLVAPRLTRSAILEALRARRTFYVPPGNPDFALVMQANGYWMGSAIPDTTSINFIITAHDPDPTGKDLKLALFDNGVQVASATLPSNVLYTWTPRIPGRLGHYYYAEAYYNDWPYLAYAYTSPIWVERPPVAEAGAPQTVAPGVAVKLDGRGSWDPDGGTLAYQWVQENGAPVGLSGANTDQPTFTTPVTLGDMVFRLSVADTGGLSDSDLTVVTVTDKPILSITKSGPATARPGELITYTLTIINNGITDATGVVITDTMPTGATYIGGGTLMPGGIVSWMVPSLAANGGAARVIFFITATRSVANADYRASCTGCVPGVGNVSVFTYLGELYLPIITKNRG